MSPEPLPTLTAADGTESADHPASLGALHGERGLFPLVAVDLDATVTGLTSRTVLTQRFVNHLDEPIEATYTFPLPDRAAVTDFTVRIDDRVIAGVLQERATARADYDGAIAAGHQAAIAEEDRPDCFTVRVGNLRPAETAELELILVGAVAFDLGEATYRFPLVVAPRYVPGVPLEGTSVGDGIDVDTDLVPDASRISPPRLAPDQPNPVDLRVQVRIDPLGTGLDDLRADGPGTVAALVDDGCTTVTLLPGARLDRDLILRWRPQLAPTGASTRATAVWTPDADGEEATIALTLLGDELVERADDPDGEPGAPGRDVVVVLDRSGSMGGWKMVAARRAAARIVDSLTAADRFAVIAFDTVVEHPPRLGPGLVVADDHHRYAAVEFLSRLEARGGTELATPVTAALDLLAAGGEAHPGRRRPCLVLVTDGQVGNEDDIVTRTATRLGDAAVFTIGIDRAVNAGFLRRLAGLGGGRCELVESEDRLDAAFATIRHRIGRPSLQGIEVDVDGGAAVAGSLTPARSRHCYPGAPLVLALRARVTDDQPQITVRATDAAGEPFTLVVPVVRRHDPAVTATWARARIRDLEDGLTAGHLDVTAEQIVTTSLRFGVLSRFTAFAAIDRSVTVASVDPVTVVQPVEVPSGWAARATGGAMPAAPMTAPPVAAIAAPPSVPMPYLGPSPARSPGSDRSGRRMGRRRRVRPEQVPTVAAAPGVPPPPPPPAPPERLAPAHAVRARHLVALARAALLRDQIDGDRATALATDLRELADDIESVDGPGGVVADLRTAALILRSMGQASAVPMLPQMLERALVTVEERVDTLDLQPERPGREEPSARSGQPFWSRQAKA